MQGSKVDDFEILGIGTPIIDHILRVSFDYLSSIPGPKGGMEPVDHETFYHIIKNSGVPPILKAGGSCFNAIRGLANLGHRCGMIGKIGRDVAADYFLKGLANLPITPLFLETDTPTTQIAALVDPKGERTFRTLLNASVELRAQDLNPVLFRGVKLVHIEGYMLLCESVPERAMELAKEAGAKISFDLASFEVVQQHKKTIFELLRDYVDVVFGNSREVFALTGESLEKSCSLLSELCEIAVVLKGKEGCLVGHKKNVITCPAFPIENPIDTTGAGDLFASGFLHGYLQSYSLEESARLGALLGASVVQVMGAEISPQTWQELAIQKKAEC